MKVINRQQDIGKISGGRQHLGFRQQVDYTHHSSL